MAISRVDPLVERKAAFESLERFRREHPDRPDRVWAHIARSCGYSSDAVDFAISHIHEKSDREKFIDSIRECGGSPDVVYSAGEILYHLSRAEIDQCIADAFNPEKGYVEHLRKEDRQDISHARKSSSFNQDLISSLRCAVGMKMYPNDPDPQYPRWVVVLCVILTIVLFLWGFFRG